MNEILFESISQSSNTVSLEIMNRQRFINAPESQLMIKIQSTSGEVLRKSQRSRKQSLQKPDVSWRLNMKAKFKKPVFRLEMQALEAAVECIS